MVICQEQGADVHMAQLTPLPLTVSCFIKIQIGITFLVPAHLGRPIKRAVKWVCVCVCLSNSRNPDVATSPICQCVLPVGGHGLNRVPIQMSGQKAGLIQDVSGPVMPKNQDHFSNILGLEQLWQNKTL